MFRHAESGNRHQPAIPRAACARMLLPDPLAESHHGRNRPSVYLHRSKLAGLQPVPARTNAHDRLLLKGSAVSTLEYSFDQAGFSRQDWDNWFVAGRGTMSSCRFTRPYALDQQEPLTRHSACLARRPGSTPSSPLTDDRVHKQRSLLCTWIRCRPAFKSNRTTTAP